MLEVYISSPNVTVSWDSDNQWVYVDWRNIPPEEEIRQGSASLVECVRLKHATKILNDNQRITGKWPTGMALEISKVWFPQLLEAGLQKFAWVQSADPGSRVSAKVSSAAIQEQEVVRFFSNEADARAWLKEE